MKTEEGALLRKTMNFIFRRSELPGFLSESGFTDKLTTVIFTITSFQPGNIYSCFQMRKFYIGWETGSQD